MVKNLPKMQETWVRPPDWEDPLEKAMATHSSILVWRIPLTEEPGRLQSMGLQRVGHNWATNTTLHYTNAYMIGTKNIINFCIFPSHEKMFNRGSGGKKELRERLTRWQNRRTLTLLMKILENVECACMQGKLLQSCLTLCDPMDCSLPGSLSIGFSRHEY